MCMWRAADRLRKVFVVNNLNTIVLKRTVLDVLMSCCWHSPTTFLFRTKLTQTITLNKIKPWVHKSCCLDGDALLLLFLENCCFTLVLCAVNEPIFFFPCFADLHPERTLIMRHKIGTFKESFSHETFKFGQDKFAFKVYVFDIKGFVTLEVSAVQITTKWYHREPRLKQAQIWGFVWEFIFSDDRKLEITVNIH